MTKFPRSAMNANNMAEVALSAARTTGPSWTRRPWLPP